MIHKKIAILRGINVGGKRKIIMDDLKAVCHQLGWKNVSTYIQSGNIIFDTDQHNDTLEHALQTAIKQTFDFDVPVIVRAAKELQALVQNNPFHTTTTDPNTLHITFLKEQPTPEHLAQIANYTYPPDKFEIHEKAVYLYCEGKYHQSKLTNQFFEKN